jgi:hypothetical protein
MYSGNPCRLTRLRDRADAFNRLRSAAAALVAVLDGDEIDDRHIGRVRGERLRDLLGAEQPAHTG